MAHCDMASSVNITQYKPEHRQQLFHLLGNIMVLYHITSAPSKGIFVSSLCYCTCVCRFPSCAEQRTERSFYSLQLLILQFNHRNQYTPGQLWTITKESLQKSKSGIPWSHYQFKGKCCTINELSTWSRLLKRRDLGKTIFCLLWLPLNTTIQDFLSIDFLVTFQILLHFKFCSKACNILL